MPNPIKTLNPSLLAATARSSIDRWWESQSPSRQDRYMVLAPLGAVLLFLAAISAAFFYLRAEEISRGQETVIRDVETMRQQIRLRLVEQQEQFIRSARELQEQPDIPAQVDFFRAQALAYAQKYPELQTVLWIDNARHVIAGHMSYSTRAYGQTLEDISALPQTAQTFSEIRQLRQPVYSAPYKSRPESHLATMQLQIPVFEQGEVTGALVVEYAIERMLPFSVSSDVGTRYAITLLDDKDQLLAGAPIPANAQSLLPWINPSSEYMAPVYPVGDTLQVRAQMYRTSLNVVGSGLFWMVCALSALTVWALLANWRHMRRRQQAQRALIAETNFRRAMENSMRIGLRAMDMQGRISYVNPAFCQMTGWDENELVGQTAPFPHWPEQDRELLSARLQDELSGHFSPGGFQVRVKRKNGTLFDARMYVSPLIDPQGAQGGWMTSMTDITEPNRIREQLSASYQRFTTVLEALDASVSVAPLGSTELLFANKLYRQWFGTQTKGHLDMVAQAGMTGAGAHDESLDEVDSFAGLPTDELTSAQSGSAEIYVAELDKWLEIRSRYLSWVDGRLAQMVIASDITARRHAEEQAARQAERAESANRLITMGEMASSVAHELNQPLAAISNYCNGMLSRLRSQQLTEDDLTKALEKTSHQAHRAGQIIQRIRAFVKRSEPNRTLSAVDVIVGEALELAELELRRRNVRLSHYVAARLPRVMADPILIEQVLINLIKNAGEAIDQAGKPSTQRNVELRVVPRQIEGRDVIEFSVRDSGPGLPAEIMSQIFDAFFTTKEEGMGIGLKLCRTIVESHQGRLQADNIYNGPDITGSRFSFWLPVASATDFDDTSEDEVIV
ncbi:PAS domain S-box protein [Comamonas sp. BIGb0124]|uniref:PAS domain-containing sensor histidine kinase n=1 Tax=Comamonas sp. BIGb0124 TaxID=2485130 RepID=UPI000F48CDFF|nr:PAS domain S-box protein [Comamonas sp. BIGb0124]